MEDYGFEYSDEEPEEQDVDIENQYYNSKGSIFLSSSCESGGSKKRARPDYLLVLLLLRIRIFRWYS
jgi:hypothetical protein